MNKLLRFLKSWRYWPICIRFLQDRNLGISFGQRFTLLKQLYEITLSFDDIPHYQGQILAFVRAILAAPRDTNGVIVEAGCYRGVSSAKFSLASKLVGKRFAVIDSFQGIPPNDEQHTIYDRAAVFNEGDYAASLEEVKRNIAQFGDLDSCYFVEGWFDDTLPNFTDSISAAYLDVDLISSTKTCIKYMWPLLEPGGAIYSQDGHLQEIIKLFRDKNFWLDEIGTKPPSISVLGKAQLLVARKPY